MQDSIKGVNSLSPKEAVKSSDGSQRVDGNSFSKVLKESLEEVNELQKKGEKAMADIATGQVKDLHQAALAINKAETSMKLMLEVRNKAISAYKEILRTQI